MNLSLYVKPYLKKLMNASRLKSVFWPLVPVRKYRGLILFLALCVVVWGIGGVSFRISGPFSNWFGPLNGLEDQFAPVGAFFSAIASAGAIFAIILQGEILERQIFETNFYQMLELHKSNRDNIYVKKATENRNSSKIVAVNNLPCCFDEEKQVQEYVTGIQAFEILNEILATIIGQTYGIANVISNKYLNKTILNEINEVISVAKTTEERFSGIYTYVFLPSIGNCLDHYFRNFYHIIKHIDTEVKKPKLRKKYFAILRAQLSPYEYALFYYNGLANDDKENGAKRSKVKRLIETNGLLQNFERRLLSDEGKAGEYSASAYKDPYDLR